MNRWTISFIVIPALFAAAGVQAQAPVNLPPPPLDNPGLPPPMSPGEIVAVAPASDWVAIPASDLLVMTLTPDARGRARRVVIQLMPAPFSQGWVANIRSLATAHWWDGLSINRVQDNYVVQWGDGDGEDPAKARTLPGGLATVLEGEYISSLTYRVDNHRPRSAPAEAPEPANSAGLGQGNSVGIDPYADLSLFVEGWPVAMRDSAFWPIHCYGMVGVGRGMSPDTGSGAELYTVIGHAPRHLDRNIAVVGRVVAGIEHLSSLPRGTGPLGFYETPQERTTITSIRLGSELPAADQPRMEYLNTRSGSFLQYAEARANRRDPFFIVPAGGADICNIPVPVRPVPVRPEPIKPVPAP